MNSEDVLRSYRRFAPWYDFFFGFSLQAGRKQGIRALSVKEGESILEIGVGTGLSLPLLQRGVKISGIDLAPEMLKKARARARAEGFESAVLEVMDAGHMAFPDGSFDKCFALYVASVTPDPKRMVSEMKRVTREGGTIMIVNHFSRPGTLSYLGERLLAPFSAWIGFEPLFRLDIFIENCGLEGAVDIPVEPWGYWRILLYQNTKRITS